MVQRAGLTLERMTIPREPTEERNADDRDGVQPGIPRLIGAAFKRERRRTKELFDALRLAVGAEIGDAEERVSHKLDQIDTSLSLIAQELSRRSGGPKSDDRG